MKRTVESMRSKRSFSIGQPVGLFCLALLCGGCAAFAQTPLDIGVGKISSGFTLPHHYTGQPVRLSDFAGQIVVLDYFAYWCSACEESSPIIEREIQAYYAASGNPSRIPVTVLAVNEDPTNPENTEKFIKNAGLQLVADDYALESYFQFITPDAFSATLYVIINGVAGSPSHKQWEVIYRQNSFEGHAPMREAIDRVQAPFVDPPVINTPPQSQTVTAGSTITLSVGVDGAPPLRYKWFKDGQPIRDATSAQLVLTNITANQAGDYAVAISNFAATRTTAPAKIVVEPRAETRPSLNGSRRTSEGAFELVLTGESGRNYRLEVSTDLAKWTTLTNLAGGVAGTLFRDVDAFRSTARFYRVVRP
jgi:thiol-disulfide isomerase/thioredoxin